MTTDHAQPTGVSRGRSVLAAFGERRLADPRAPAVHYYGRTLTRDDLDRLSGRLAARLVEAGVGQSDRVAVSLQNTPVFAIALLATWKLGAVLVPVSPMLRANELTSLLSDCGPRVLIAHPEVADTLTAAFGHLEETPEVLWSNAADYAGAQGARWLPEPAAPTYGKVLLTELARPIAEPVVPHDSASDDLALLVYTSGTTGPSKGAMLSHANIGYQATVAAGALGVEADDIVLTTAPFFHITGLGLHLALGLGGGLPLVMTYRFDPDGALALIEQYKPSFTVGTITAYIALAERARSDGNAHRALSQLTSAISGGAAVPAAVIDRYESEFGVYIRNGYGLTETSSVCVVVPAGERAPVHAGSGATSIGRPLPDVDVTIVADDGHEAPVGETGEIVVRGPQIGQGYWNRSDETANAFGPRGLRTGDIGIIDEHGWIYLVDRKKDLIVVSGYKVWPRDVEDALYKHAAVAEAGVIGVPDDYRGESVSAYVVPRPGMTVTAAELNRHCRASLSAYKCPRHYQIVDSLPKSASGKILRRLLGD